MRNFSKNKFLLCFRPVVHIDAMLQTKVATHRSTSCRFSCIPASHKNDIVKSSDSKSVYFHHVSPKRTISRAIKAVFFETILNRRTRHKNRYTHDSFGSSKHGYYAETKTPSSSPSSCPQPQSSSQSKNVSSTNEKNRESPVEKQNKLECYGIYLILISLVFTVFWGKLFGIILTSSWLYVFSVLDTCNQKLPSCARHRQSLLLQQCKDRGHYGKCATREVP
ncbi:uncharacterized protein LOC113859704 [Abrus precatorius]|uniref:Uncharacterized protein LOC113859704 n=1 Tax=Abrus precatorius TaxID=3816 RepID=A0A8B8KWD2_ABRPR|nr:uncharacterized protein LOC113859704 [Abrus precatorius]